MKKVLILLMLSIMTFACKNDSKSETNSELKQIDQEANIDTQESSTPKVKLPENVVQLNSEIYQFPIEGITLTKVQIENTKDDNFVYKLFFDTDQIEKFKTGNYSFFVQNIPYESDKQLLDENDQSKGLQSFWMNLSSAKTYKDEYVVFRSFKSSIVSFEKIVVGVMDLVNKKDVFRVTFDNPFILN